MSFLLKLYKLTGGKKKKLTGNPIKQLQLCDQARKKKKCKPISITDYVEMCWKWRQKEKKISYTRIISSVILIPKVLDKLNPYFTSLPIGPSVEVSWGFCFTYTFFSLTSSSIYYLMFFLQITSLGLFICLLDISQYFLLYCLFNCLFIYNLITHFLTRGQMLTSCSVLNGFCLLFFNEKWQLVSGHQSFTLPDT